MYLYINADKYKLYVKRKSQVFKKKKKNVRAIGFSSNIPSHHHSK